MSLRGKELWVTLYDCYCPYSSLQSEGEVSEEGEWTFRDAYII